jgi:predicted MFS family arabinose efflux permease
MLLRVANKIPDIPVAPVHAGRRGLLVLLSVSAGLGVANLYYAQPLAATMAGALHVSAGAIGLSLMACQLGYALGMLLLVPLGDGRERRRLMVQATLATGVSALLVAFSSSYALLVIASAVLGFSCCLPQMAIPFAVGLVNREARGDAIGAVMTGLLTGILLSRTASGLLAAAVGWRATFLGAAALMVLLAAVLRLSLPPQRPPEPLAWRAVVISLPGVLRAEPLLRRHALLGAVGFAAFSMFWATLSFQLAALGHGPRTAGLFGVLGLAGVVVAPLIGRHAERLGPARVNVAALSTLAASFVISSLASRSLPGLAVGAILLDVGMQANHLTNQTVIFGLTPALRNRINAIYMVVFFVGGAAGTTLGSWAWEMARWNGVCLAGALISLAGLVPVLKPQPPGIAASPPSKESRSPS